MKKTVLKITKMHSKTEIFTLETHFGKTSKEYGLCLALLWSGIIVSGSFTLYRMCNLTPSLCLADGCLPQKQSLFSVDRLKILFVLSV